MSEALSLKFPVKGIDGFLPSGTVVGDVLQWDGTEWIATQNLPIPTIICAAAPGFNPALPTPPDPNCGYLYKKDALGGLYWYPDGGPEVDLTTGGGGAFTLTADDATIATSVGSNITFAGAGGFTTTAAGAVMTMTDRRYITPFTVGTVASESEYTTIQAAVDAAALAGGGVILIRAGSYVGDVTVPGGVGIEFTGAGMFSTSINGTITLSAGSIFTMRQLNMSIDGITGIINEGTVFCLISDVFVQLASTLVDTIWYTSTIAVGLGGGFGLVVNDCILVMSASLGRTSTTISLPFGGSVFIKDSFLISGGAAGTSIGVQGPLVDVSPDFTDFSLTNCLVACDLNFSGGGTSGPEFSRYTIMRCYILAGSLNITAIASSTLVACFNSVLPTTTMAAIAPIGGPCLLLLGCVVGGAGLTQTVGFSIITDCMFFFGADITVTGALNSIVATDLFVIGAITATTAGSIRISESTLASVTATDVASISIANCYMSGVTTYDGATFGEFSDNTIEITAGAIPVFTASTTSTVYILNNVINNGGDIAISCTSGTNNIIDNVIIQLDALYAVVFTGTATGEIDSNSIYNTSGFAGGIELDSTGTSPSIDNNTITVTGTSCIHLVQGISHIISNNTLTTAGGGSAAILIEAVVSGVDIIGNIIRSGGNKGIDSLATASTLNIGDCFIISSAECVDSITPTTRIYNSTFIADGATDCITFDTGVTISEVHSCQIECSQLGVNVIDSGATFITKCFIHTSGGFNAILLAAAIITATITGCTLTVDSGTGFRSGSTGIVHIHSCFIEGDAGLFSDSAGGDLYVSNCEILSHAAVTVELVSSVIARITNCTILQDNTGVNSEAIHFDAIAIGYFLGNVIRTLGTGANAYAFRVTSANTTYALNNVFESEAAKEAIISTAGGTTLNTGSNTRLNALAGGVDQSGFGTVNAIVPF